MKWLRFYYFSFLHFYKDKPESWVSEYRSLFLVQITVSSAFLFIWLAADPNLKSTQSYTRLTGLALNIVILAFLHKYLLYKAKYKLIYNEFKDDALNTRRSRAVCWLIWCLSFIAPMILAVIQKGGISWK